MMRPRVAPVIGGGREAEQLGAAAPPEGLHGGPGRDLVAVAQQQETSAPGIGEALPQAVPHRSGLRPPERVRCAWG